MTQALPRAMMTKQATRTQAPPLLRHQVGDTRNQFTVRYTRTARKVTLDRAGQKWVLTSVNEFFIFMKEIFSEFFHNAKKELKIKPFQILSLYVIFQCAVL